jgi:hypothetical protein
MARSGVQTAKYVYGVVRAPSKAKRMGNGISGKPVRVVASKGIGALASDVPPGPLDAGREELLAHSRVLEKALEHGVVLPMRFGVVMPGEAAVRGDLLDAHRPDLEAQLEEMSGKIEVNVKGIYDEASIMREVVQENREIAALRESVQSSSPDAAYYDRIRLGELVAGALEAKREADEASILDKLAPRALDMDVGAQIHERLVVNASFLLERERLKDFDDVLEKIAAENHPRIGFKLTGPLPPHSFVELTVEG